ncbi:unnamed protein product [Brachionus calyciflorus]|uniref:Uncharacterized protein n=1 Tax=Brachionus calyciflorus TaxID=104777 RepID=A0A814GH25_9BILA|nr:unnamed protein product [Brachionus calyciflorus]
MSSENFTYNWFNSKIYWSDQYKCLDKNCDKIFTCICKNEPLDGQDVIFEVQMFSSAKHEQIVKKSKCTGKKREEYALKLMSEGVAKLRIMHEKVYCFFCFFHQNPYRDKKAVVKKKKTVVGNLNVEGVAGAFRNFHFYVGNWNNSTTKEKVVEYINKFAKVNKIEELTTKYNYYKSFHVEVNDCYNSKMLNPESWPVNVRVKRFYLKRETKEKVSVENNVQMGTEENNPSDLN